jgi:phosphomannomutase/phosphoglucomutase
MITGSHNPPEFNGMKLSVDKETLYGDKIQEIRKISGKGDFIRGTGKAEVYEVIPRYLEYLRHSFPPLTGIKVVIDAGNGTAGFVAPHVMRGLGCEVTELYCDPDGHFPNHHPDPVVMENLKDLIEKVLSSGADIGIGYDGDADRIGVINDKGEVIWGDMLLVIFARDIIERRKAEGIQEKPIFIGDVKCSQIMYDEIERIGGNPIMWKTGHSLIKHKVKETGAPLGGELSGHMFFADRYFGYDDAIYASLRLLEILSKIGRPYSLDRLLRDIPKSVTTPEIRVECPDDIKFQVVTRAKKEFTEYHITDIDGIRIHFNKGWGLIRASNTQPALVLRFEAQDEHSLRDIQNIVEEKLDRIMAEFSL